MELDQQFLLYARFQHGIMNTIQLTEHFEMKRKNCIKFIHAV